MKRILAILLVISLSLTFLMLAIENSSYNKSYYIKAFYKYNIEKETGKSMEELEIITDGLINYLKGKGGEELLQPHFNEREISHMEDVLKLFDYARIVKFIAGLSALLIMVYLSMNKEFKLLGKTISFGLFANHIILAILSLLIFIDFNKYFTIFHKIFFTNDLWILDPNTDLMIQMLPEPFFIGMAIKIGLSFFVYLSILQIGGYFYIKKGSVKLNEKYSGKDKR